MDKQNSLLKLRITTGILVGIISIIITSFIAPFSFFTGFLSGDELMELFKSPSIYGLTLLISLIAFSIHFLMTKSLTKNYSQDELVKVLKNSVKKVFAVYFIELLVQWVMLYIIFNYIIPLEISNWFLIGVLIELAFYGLFGSLILTYVFSLYDKYFREVYYGSEKIISLKHKLTLIVFLNIFGTVILFIGAGLTSEEASILGRQLPLGSLGVNLIAGVTTLVVLVIILGRLTRTIIKPVEYQVAAFREATQGNFKISVPVLSTDEISEVGAVTNGFFKELISHFSKMEQVIVRLVNNKEQLNDNFASLSSALHQINIRIEDTNLQVEENSANVTETSAVVEQLTQNIDALGKTINTQNENLLSSNAHVHSLVEASEELNNISESNAAKVTNLVKVSDQSKKSLKQMSGRIASITESSTQLVEANSLISDVASQTNLLAMNAAIEAAHAGESGRGFSVVAAEIRKFSETSSSQSSTIGSNLNNVTATIITLGEDSKQVESGFSSVSNVVEDLENLNNKLNSFMNSLKVMGANVTESLQNMKIISSQVLSGSDEMRSGNSEILRSVTSMSEANVKIKEAIKEISLGTKTVTESTDEVKKQNEITDDVIKTLRDILQNFDY